MLVVVGVSVAALLTLVLIGYGVSCLLPTSSPFAFFCHVPEIALPEPLVPPAIPDARVMQLDTTATIARVVAEWDVLQKSITLSPTLGATAWRPTDIQFIGKGNLLVRFEDGHVSAVAVVRSNGVDAFTYTATLQDEPWTEARWREVVGQYGDPAFPPQTYTTSIVRGDSVQTFSGWTEVPENVFVSQ